jgi:hypothetical protein
MADDQLEYFLSEYDDATNDALNSKSATIETNLERWFEILDETPAIALIVNQLENRVDFRQTWPGFFGCSRCDNDGLPFPLKPPGGASLVGKT